MRMVFAAIAICVTSPAYADTFAKFYQSVDHPMVEPSAAPPRVVASSIDVRAEVADMWRRGYIAVGYSSFNGPLKNPNKAAKHARKVGAEIVTYRMGDVSEQSSVIPLSMPQTNYGTTTGTFSAQSGYGGRPLTGNYSSTTTTTGTQTTYIPFTTRRADQMLVFWAPAKKGGFGILPIEPSDREKAELGTNRALSIIAVRNGSASYAADLLPNDIILTIQGQPATLDLLAKAVDTLQTSDVTFTIMRNGARREIIVRTADRD